MNELKTTFKSILPYLIIGILLLLLINKCDSEPKPTHSNKDSLNTIIAEKEQIAEYAINENKTNKLIIDSLKHLKPKVVIRYRTVYDSLLVTDSTCVKSINILYTECQKVDSVNNSIIDTQSKVIQNDSTIINNYKDIIAIQKMRIKTDSVDIEYLTLSVKKEKRKGKLKTFLGSVLGTLAGFGIGSLR